MAFGGERPDELILPAFPYMQSKVDGDAALAFLKSLNAKELSPAASE